MFRHDPAHTGATNSSAPTTMPSVLWRFQASSITSSPAIAEGFIYLTDYTGNFYCLNVSTGTQIWSASGSGSPAVHNGLVYVGHNIVTAYNASTGAKVWSDQAQYGSGGTSPTVTNDIVYTSFNGLYAYNALTGAKIWNNTNSNQFSSPAIANDIVYFNGYSSIIAFDALTGTQVWQFTPKSPTEQYHLSSSTVYNNRIYVGLSDNLYCLDAKTGNELWNYSKGTFGSSPVIANGIVYFGNQDFNFYALNASSGAKIWNYTTGYVIDSSPAVAGGAVYVGSGDGNLYAFNITTGTKLWNFTLQPRLDEHGSLRYLFASPAIANGIIYMGSSDGTLYALGTPQTLVTSQPTNESPSQMIEITFLAVALFFLVAGLIVIRKKRAGQENRFQQRL